MLKSIKLFYYFLMQSIEELKNNYKIYFIYFLSFLMVIIVQNGLDFFYIKNDLILKILSKILFSTIPVLISSKILYIMKIRHSGLGEYKTIVWRYLIYNVYYFCLVLLAASLYLFSSYLISNEYPIQTALAMTLPLLAPLIYIMVYYSFSPFVAVFDDEESGNVFSKAKKLSTKNVYLVIINHLFSLLIPIIFSMNMLLDSSKFKFLSVYYFSIPEAIFSILIILTTTRIYFYLLDLE